MPKTIGNPLSWTMNALGSAAGYTTVVATPARDDAPPQTRRLTMDDLRTALRKGWEDLAAMRSDVMFACMLYPLMGAVLLGLAAQGSMTHLLFPVLSGFALVGPVAGLGLYELSRRREAGLEVGWASMFDVLRSPRFPRIIMLALFNGVIFMAWLLLADAIHAATLGPGRPASLHGSAERGGLDPRWLDDDRRRDRGRVRAGGRRAGGQRGVLPAAAGPAM